jgi:hypothetical protein
VITVDEDTLESDFWKKVFATEKVYPNREHVKYIWDLFRQEKYFKEDYGCLFSLNANGIVEFIKNRRFKK